MLALRIFGAIFAIALFLIAVYRYPRRQISRLNLIISWGLGIVIILLAIVPNLFNPLFDLFNFRPGGQRRLLATELFAILVLFALIVRNMSYTDVANKSVRDLVEALTLQAFDWEKANQLPPGRRVVVVRSGGASSRSPISSADTSPKPNRSEAARFLARVSANARRSW